MATTQERRAEASWALYRRYVLENPYLRRIDRTPTTKQARFLSLYHVREALYGGAAGGGKSDALLMDALQFVEIPGYAAIIFRKTYKDLALPDAIMARSHEWLRGSDAKWSQTDFQWTFPGGATLTFGYLDSLNDRYRYQGAAFHFIGTDELAQHAEANYRYMLSRNRRKKDESGAALRIPLRVRGATNPPTPQQLGYEWLEQRFLVEGESRGRFFIPAGLDDNPHLDAETYRQSLRELPPGEREQLLKGVWRVRAPGKKFKREWFKEYNTIEEWLGVGDGDMPHSVALGLLRSGRVRIVRRWDMAATEPDPKKGNDPDWTAGCLLAKDVKEGRYLILDMRRCRKAPGDIEAFVARAATDDAALLGGKHRVRVRMEQEPGSSGKIAIDHFRRYVLQGYDFEGIPSTGDKEVRANPVSSAAQNGIIGVLRGRWLSAFYDEAEAFPDVPHDDQVDALSGGFADLNSKSGYARAWD